MERWRINLLSIACCVIAAMSGCSRTPAPGDALSQEARRLVSLPGLRSSSHPQLVAELQKIEAARQTPQQIDNATDGNHYAPFVTAYPSFSRPAIQREVNSLWPAVSLSLEPGALQKARELLQQQAAARQRFDRAMRETSPRPQLEMSDALVADDEWLDAIQTGCRIEAFATADMLAEQQPDAALAPVEKILHLSRQLAREQDLNARLAAVDLRADGLQAIHAIANHPLATPETLQRLQQLIRNNLTDWPSDERVWIAERAHGLLSYELARAGQFNALLTGAQLAELQKKGIAATTATAVLKNIESDELFYLRAIEQQIAAARVPYFQRQNLVEQLRLELQSRSESGEYPLVAGSLLLTKVGEVHRRLAEDRTRCEAWLIVLTTVCELPLGTPPSCPLTGQPYEVRVDRERVVIAGLELRPGETVEVRRPGVVQARRRAAGFDLTSPPLRLQ
ncbi:hypothetical protein [Anatilimnocola floriformis]|uniref:hypothetical protein n=1 Tax=Anatilimnocola floriformis TaxID=2948575 RepID=UPI0020C48C3A|nr:hypothetical protein [Anatilimnocola floriformis]